MNVEQYQLVLVNLDPTIGSEIRKTRPCVIISPDEMNRNLQTIVIAPVTSSQNAYPTRVKIDHYQVYGQIALDQIRTIDKRRIIKILGELQKPEIKKVKEVLQATYVDN